MIQIKKGEQTSSIQNNINLPKNTKNIVQIKEKIENELLSNSGTSISSNTDIYNNFVSKFKLNYHLKNPKIHTQTIILHPNLDKSYSELNDSLSQIEINNEPKFDDCFKNQNYSKEYSDQLNKGFILDSSQNSPNTNNLNNQKRNEINYINKLYGEEKNNNDENIQDKYDNNNSSEKSKKDNLTINFNNNLFFVNDNNEPKNYPLKILFNNNKNNNESTFQDKVFSSNNPFDDSYPCSKKDQNKQTNLLPYGYQNNSFCGPKQDKNNIKDNNIIFPEQKNNNKNPLNQKFSSLNDLSTNQNTNNYDNIVNDDKNNKEGISKFNYGNNNPSVISFGNLGNSESEINNNQNQNNKPNFQISFNPQNLNNIIENNDKDDNISYTSKIFPGKNYKQNENFKNQNHPNFYNNNDSFENNGNEPSNLGQNKNFGPTNNFIPNKEYPSKLENDLNQEQLIEYSDIKEDNNKNNSNSNSNPNLNNSLDENNPNNNINNSNPNLNNSLNENNPNNNVNNKIKLNNNNYLPLDINTNNNIDPKNTIIYDNNDNSLSLENNENLDIEKKQKDKENNKLKSLLYGLLLGSATTGLLWLTNEERRKYFLEKFGSINFNSIINLFKYFLHPIDFFKRILSHEKRDVYLKVLGLTFGKFFDFLEKYGDGIRFLGTFLSILIIWFIIKFLIKWAIKMWKKHKKELNKI